MQREEICLHFSMTLTALQGLVCVDPPKKVFHHHFDRVCPICWVFVDLD